MNLWLTLHLIGVVLFVGNIITAAFWKIRADLTKKAAEIHRAVKNVMLADYIFTIPGLALIIVSGSRMAERAGMPMSGFNWLMLSLILFMVSGIIWAVILIPLQLKMIRHSAQCIESGTISKAYRDASRLWAVFGIAATLLPLVILYLMVTKGF
ncbi:hypothetical protein DRW41_00445 [Neobacillus piezotolerans]|uniref:DUF2269 domain-containing protein n=1 Tax=Neobacillus piezotolerans TaxID=2259171 RepID=A0A3D8GUD4_9BACI|nr:DUF2269 family protein [Neobacillus piezotolerans]RDU38080.1 hypothetical protein DRW41_00445 [Neobacillus piezotolerans]